MLTPKEVEYWGKKKEDENYAFRAFLKRSADPADLDKRFRNLRADPAVTFASKKHKQFHHRFLPPFYPGSISSKKNGQFSSTVIFH